MSRRHYLTVALLAALPCVAIAGSNSIGTATARGDMRVDSYTVKGNATLFDGSVVQTTVATADMRLSKGVEVMLASDSQGTLYRDRLVLQRGAGELASSGSFAVEADGVRVTANAPNTRGVVSVRSGSNVEIAALTGGFAVTTDSGAFLANVVPGRGISLPSFRAGVKIPAMGSGTIGALKGHYFFTTATGTKYELKGNTLALHALVGKTATISGNLDPSATPANGASGVIVLSSDPDTAGDKTCPAGKVLDQATGKCVRSGGPPLEGSGAGLFIGLGLAGAGGLGALAALAAGTTGKSASP